MMEFWGLFYFVWTVLCYFFAKEAFIRTRKIYCSPIIVAPLLSIGLILLRHSFQDYYRYTQYLVAITQDELLWLSQFGLPLLGR